MNNEKKQFPVSDKKLLLKRDNETGLFYDIFFGYRIFPGNSFDNIGALRHIVRVKAVCGSGFFYKTSVGIVNADVGCCACRDVFAQRNQQKSVRVGCFQS